MLAVRPATNMLSFTALVKKQHGFPGGSVVKSSSAKAEDAGSIPELGRSPGGGNGNPLQYSCLGNPTDRRVWWATVHGISESQTCLRDYENNKEAIYITIPQFRFNLNDFFEILILCHFKNIILRSNL